MMPDLRLIGSNGDEITFSSTRGGTFATGSSPRGFGIAPTEVAMVEGAGDGARYRFTRKGVRDIDLPVYLFGADRAEVHARQRRLSNALRDLPSFPAAKLVYTTEPGDVYSIEVHYVAGAETQFGDGVTGERRARWLLTLRCPDPFWTARDAVSIPALRSSSADPFLSELAALHVGASQVIGDVLVENPGDVDAPVTWVLNGPGDAWSFTRNDGQSFTLGAIVAGETITVDTARGTVVDQLGANRYALLGSAPKLFSFPGGSSTVSVSVVNATAETVVNAFFKPRVEVMF